MTEDQTNEALAYLLDEMARPRRAAFEALLARDPALVALVKSVADSLAAEALAQSPAAPLTAAERGQRAVGLLAALPARPAASSNVLRRFFWPLAATFLLALNLGQWISHSRPRPLTVDLVDNTETAPLPNPGLVLTGAHPGKSPAAPNPNAGATTISISQTLTLTHPYAWSAFDHFKHQGRLDLHNLPAVAADQQLVLWILPTGERKFEQVGAIPSQLYGRSGSINYRLNSEAVIPAQIMITVERKGTPPAGPSGLVVLHGP